MDLDLTRPFVARHIGEAVPGFQAALLSGSVVRGHATATSDVDVVVLLPEGMGGRRETVSWEGTTVDIFAYDTDTLDRYLAKDTERRRPTLCSLVLDGLLVAGDPAAAERAVAAARKVFDAGPRPVPAAELDRMRYGVTDLLLDVEGSGDRGETLILAATLVQALGDFVLAAAGRWTGQGKWLLRELRAYDKELAAGLVAAHDELARSAEVDPLVGLVDTVLAGYGGRYLVGRAEVG
ncbi:nucleotidyltransferase domain-containing protein [Actinopolymorpha alba]|uniref:nucleotidyltransferase domain-containing protein n=1 Tax=Actinopolymorpha alba TaxID=533267 RepID=UPI0003792515|nr:nucleotidyltransferase domain-containing protein [Actinopolymorpha alba]